MPKLTVPTKYIVELKELGVYDQWLQNVKNQWDNTEDCWINPDSSNHNHYVRECIQKYDVETFIVDSFNFFQSNEGHGFWSKINYKK